MSVSNVLKGNNRPIIGLLIYRDRANVLVRSVAEGYSQPIGIADFSELTPEKLCGLPFAIEGIVTELRRRNRHLLRNL